MKRVLLCEDEGITVFSLRHALIRAGYVIVAEEADGAKAVALVRQLKPDLVLMDIGLSGPLSGLDAAREILQEQTLPIIVLIAYGDEGHRQAAQQAGVCGYLVKPVTSEHLVPEIEAALARFAARQEATALA